MLAKKEIAPGQQIFSHYGDSSWFTARGIQEYSFQDMESRHFDSSKDIRSDPYVLPGCPTLLTIAYENSLYAQKDIKRGQVIEIARVLLVPERFLEISAPLDVFVWWHPSTRGTKKFKGFPRPAIPGAYNTSESYGIVLTGHGSLYDGVRNPEEDVANVAYDWWSLEDFLAGAKQIETRFAKARRTSDSVITNDESDDDDEDEDDEDDDDDEEEEDDFDEDGDIFSNIKLSSSSAGVNLQGEVDSSPSSSSSSSVEEKEETTQKKR